MADARAELVEAAKAHVARAERGDAREVHYVLAQAAVALRDVIGGRMPDRERVEYLRFLLRALDLAATGVSPAKALGLGEGGRPKAVSPDRDTWLFIAVGVAYGKCGNVTVAVKSVAKRYGIGAPTVRKAWQANGALTGWRRVEAEGEAE